eukprot:362161-Chlamydomonas_euryale.AAC.4
MSHRRQLLTAAEARKIAPARNKPSHKAFPGDEQDAFDSPGGCYEAGRARERVAGTAALARNAATQRQALTSSRQLRHR